MKLYLNLCLAAILFASATSQAFQCGDVLRHLQPWNSGLSAEDLKTSKINFVPLSPLNMNRVFKVAKEIFPGDVAGVRAGYLASLLPSSVLSFVSRNFSSVELDRIKYFAAQKPGTNEIVGVTGLYSVKGKSEAWLGWYGVNPNFRGQGHGNVILDWSILTAQKLGYKTLRLWTSTADEYKVANLQYIKKGFIRQDLEVAEPKDPKIKIILYSLSLDGQPPLPFNGSLQEALLGATAKDIEDGVRAYKTNL